MNVPPTNLEPVVWDLLGYRFDAASMLAALCACFLVRLRQWLGSRAMNARSCWLHAVVTALALLFTAGGVLLQCPSPFFALLGGAGFGALGSGIITIAVAWVNRIEPIATVRKQNRQSRRRPRASKGRHSRSGDR